MWPATAGQKSQDATFLLKPASMALYLWGTSPCDVFQKKKWSNSSCGKTKVCPTQAHGHCKGLQYVLVYQEMEVKLQPCCLHAIQKVNVKVWVGDDYMNREKKKKETKLFLLSCNYTSSEFNIHNDFCNSSKCQTKIFEDSHLSSRTLWDKTAQIKIQARKSSKSCLNCCLRSFFQENPCLSLRRSKKFDALSSIPSIQ